MSEGFELDFDYPALPDRLWDALTNRTKLATWFMPSDLVAELGHRFTLRPDRTTTLVGPIEGEVVGIERPRRIVLDLRGTGFGGPLTLVVEPARGGSRLRLSQAGWINDPDGLRDEYRRLFGERLVAALRGGMIARVSPRPAGPGTPAPAGTAGPAGTPPARATEDALAQAGEDALARAGADALAQAGADQLARWDGRSGADLPGASPRPGTTHRPGPIMAGLVALAIAIGLFAFAQVLPDASEPAAGTQAINGADTNSRAPTRGAGSGGTSAGVGHPSGGGDGRGGGTGTTAVGGPASTMPTGRPPTSGPAAAGALAVAFVIERRTLLGYQVRITLHNGSGHDQSWSTVRVHYDGAHTLLGQVAATVQFSGSGSATCFFPAPGSQTLAPDTSFSFTYSVAAVAGLLSTVDSVTLDDARCVRP